MRFTKPGKSAVYAFIALAALVGGGAAAVSLQDDDESEQPSPERSQQAAVPTESSPFDALGLGKLEPSAITGRETFGRIRVVPAGGPLEWDSSFEPQANLQAGELPARGDGASGLPTRDAGPFEPSLPAGFNVEEAGSLGKRVAGVRSFVSGSMRLSKEGENRPITLEYWQLKPGAVVEVTAFSNSGVWDISEVTATTGFLQSMSPGAGFETVLNADFVVGELYFRLRAPGTSPEELVDIVSAIRNALPQ